MLQTCSPKKLGESVRGHHSLFMQLNLLKKNVQNNTLLLGVSKTLLYVITRKIYLFYLYVTKLSEWNQTKTFFFISDGKLNSNEPFLSPVLKKSHNVQLMSEIEQNDFW